MLVKKVVLVFIAAAIFAPLFAQNAGGFPKMDFIIQVYAYSLNGDFFSVNPRFGELTGDEPEHGDFMVMTELRGDIASVGDFSFAWAWGFSVYSTYKGDSDTMSQMSIGLSPGVGVYLNKWSESSLTGPCLFLYPIYQFPVLTVGGGDPEYWLKHAVDLGYNFRVLKWIALYPYMRGVLAWEDWKPKTSWDIGICVGLYIQDQRYKGKEW